MGITSLTKEQIAQTIISQLEEQADDLLIETGLLKNYNSPTKIVQRSNLAAYYPDILTSYKGEISIYEIELNSRMDAKKWQFLSLYTKLRRGEFFVIVPEPYISKAEQLIIENDLKNIKLLFVPN